MFMSQLLHFVAVSLLHPCESGPSQDEGTCTRGNEKGPAASFFDEVR